MYVIAVVVAAAWLVGAAIYYLFRGVGLVVVLLCQALASQFSGSKPRTQDIRLSLYRADAKVQAAARQARQEMNAAAGQSWRDIID